MGSTVLLGKRLRRQIRVKVWPVLEAEGFAEFGPLRAFRIGDDRIEVVEFATFRREWREPRWLGGDAFANGGTFTLHVGTYFAEGDQTPRPRPYAHECHRALRLAHESMDSAADGRTFWPGHDGQRLDAVIDEAVRVLRARGLDALAKHSKDEPCSAGHFEDWGLSEAETVEMMRICREGRAARADALHDLHRRLHLADEVLVA